MIPACKQSCFGHYLQLDSNMRIVLYVHTDHAVFKTTKGSWWLTTFICLFTWNRGILDLNLRNCIIDKQSYHDEFSRKQREKERDVRNLKKMELLLKVSWDALTQTQALHQRLLIEVGAVHRCLTFKLSAVFFFK